MISDDLASRLLAAADNTYFRDPEHEAQGPSAASLRLEGADGANYRGRPAMFIGGPVYEWLPPFRGLLHGDVTIAATRDAATVGVTPTEIIVACRGTLPFPGAKDRKLVGSDWLNDMNALPCQTPHVPGWVHPGFAEAVDSVWRGVLTELRRLEDAYPGLPICFTGHSKGGPMAQIAAARYHGEGGARPIYVCTFAGARAGDRSFAEAFAEIVTDARRYEYGDDIVPHLPGAGGFRTNVHLPPEIAALAQTYLSAGPLYYLPTLRPGAARGQPQRQAQVNEADRLRRITLEFLEMAKQAAVALVGGPEFDINRSWIAENHDIGAGSGYYRWIHRP